MTNARAYKCVRACVRVPMLLLVLQIHLNFVLFVRSSIWMDSASSNRGLSHISVEFLGDMDACPPVAFQANGNQNFKNMKVGQIIPFQTVSFMIV